MKATARRLGLAGIRSGPVAALSFGLTRSRLRILGYHGVAAIDAAAFHDQMAWLASHWTPVSETQVLHALETGEALPERAVWVTFDDGDPSVVEHGLPTLEQFRIPATMFICPGLIDSAEPFWWRLTQWADGAPPTPRGGTHAHRGGHDPYPLADAGHDHGVRTGRQTLTEFVKTIPDPARRTIIDELSAEFARRGVGLPKHWRQLSDDELRIWTEAGMTLGCHTWDHPCLDQCEPDLQREQLTRSATWFEQRQGSAPRTFAYPNGNQTDVVDAELARTGYRCALLYDHRLTDMNSPPLRLSRLHADAGNDVAKLSGSLSGAQPALRSAVRTFKRG